MQATRSELGTAPAFGNAPFSPSAGLLPLLVTLAGRRGSGTSTRSLRTPGASLAPGRKFPGDRRDSRFHGHLRAGGGEAGARAAWAIAPFPGGEVPGLIHRAVPLSARVWFH